MPRELRYGSAAKWFHWVIVGLLVTQYLVGWLMPDIHRGMLPGTPMMVHISVGVLILALTAARFAWRITHPIAPESSLPAWQRLSSEAIHWLLYLAVFATTLTGWFFASMRGWSIRLFGLIDLPMLTGADSPIARTLGRWHETLEWTLLVLVGLHVGAALVHLFIYRDRVMARMLPSTVMKA